MASQYRETPLDTDKMPPGIGYIVGNEAAERFSFYGMRAILYVFMTEYLLTANGEPAFMEEAEARRVGALFRAALYFLPLIGGVLADAVFGKYLTIMSLSVVYCLGHFVLALTLNPEISGGIVSPTTGLFTGLFLISLGGGFIKSCVSAHVGDQFGRNNTHLLPRVFGWFYFSINFGSTASTLLTPKLLEWYGPDVAFGVPGIFMLIATIAFWLGRKEYAHVPAKGFGTVREAFSPVGLKALANLAMIYAFVAVFWALFDQTTDAWVEQAKHMDRVYVANWLPESMTGLASEVEEGTYLREEIEPTDRVVELSPSQLQAANPILVMMFIPLFGYAIYPAVNAVWTLTPLRKMSVGLFLTAAAWAVSVWIQKRIDAGAHPDIFWQIVAYVVLTAAEVMVSITGLEFSYTQAPKAMKSIVMGVWLLSVWLGNIFVAAVNYGIELDWYSLEGENYYWFWQWAILLTAVLFVPATLLYRGKTYTQDAPDDGSETGGVDPDGNPAPVRTRADRGTAQPESAAIDEDPDEDPPARRSNA
ncbi:POT family MFS transporter [Alienimonas sp. DA493]|uniref:POT family MFS transporter n=1 Tax=Alienimonas sp. DA493 TaxID=3373605 RepID=UPI003754931B